MSEESKKRHVAASVKYNQQNVKQIKINLNLKTDQDIIMALAETGNVQGYIKELIRKEIKSR